MLIEFALSATGSLTAQTGYDAFGSATNAAFPTRYQFTGRERDDFTGLMHYRARHYDPKLGRFISEDPIGFAGGDVNLYGYVGNRPLALRDPTGTVAIPAVAYAIFEVCATGYDVYDFYSTFSNPNSDWGDVALGGGGLLLGTALPGGGYGSVGKAVRNHFGRRGSPDTRDQLDEIRDQVLDANPGYSHVGGGRNRVTGDDIPEEYLPNLNGGRRGGSYADLTFEAPDGSRMRFNTYDANSSGVPTTREADAADRLFRNSQGSPVVLVPKRKCVPCKE